MQVKYKELGSKTLNTMPNTDVQFIMDEIERFHQNQSYSTEITDLFNSLNEMIPKTEAALLFELGLKELCSDVFSKLYINKLQHQSTLNAITLVICKLISISEVYAVYFHELDFITPAIEFINSSEEELRHTGLQIFLAFSKTSYFNVNGFIETMQNQFRNVCQKENNLSVLIQIFGNLITQTFNESIQCLYNNVLHTSINLILPNLSAFPQLLNLLLEHLSQYLTFSMTELNYFMEHLTINQLHDIFCYAENETVEHFMHILNAEQDNSDILQFVTSKEGIYLIYKTIRNRFSYNLKLEFLHLMGHYLHRLDNVLGHEKIITKIFMNYFDNFEDEDEEPVLLLVDTLLILCSVPSAELFTRVLIEENIDILDQMIENNIDNEELCEKIEILKDTLIYW